MKTADVVIIGGGVTGVSIAFHLAELGVKRVMVLERGSLGPAQRGGSGAVFCHLHRYPNSSLRCGREIHRTQNRSCRRFLRRGRTSNNECRARRISEDAFRDPS